MAGRALKQTSTEAAVSEEPRLTKDSQLLLVGISYRTSRIQFREALAKALARTPNWSTAALEKAKEHAVLSTCNRLEVYLVSESPQDAYDALVEGVRRATGEGGPEKALSVLQGADAVHHLFRVAAGLDSVVVGEPQIMAQVRGAGIASRRAGSAKGILSPLFDSATRAGERVRSAHSLGDGEDTLSDIAVKEALRGLPPKGTVMLIGTGKMVQLASRRLMGRVGRIYVASRRRTIPRGLEGAALIRYSEIPKIAPGCDAIISATSVRRPLLRSDYLKRGRPKTVIDLGMPRNVEGAVRRLDNVRLLDLDDIARAASRVKPPKNLGAAEKSASREASEFYSWLFSTKLSSTLSEIYGWADRVREEELKRASGRLKLQSERDLRVVDAMGRRIVSKLMARPAAFAHSKHGLLTEDEKLDLLRAVFGSGADAEA